MDFSKRWSYNLCMPRIARIVVPGIPHHVTQRGNRRLPTFFSDQDYKCYLSIMAELCAKWGVEIWAYCLMPNHVHLLALQRNLKNHTPASPAKPGGSGEKTVL